MTTFRPDGRRGDDLGPVMEPDVFEHTLDIEQAQLRGFARSIAEVEWLLLILVMLHLFIAKPQRAHDPWLIAILGAFALFTLAFRYAKFRVGARPKITLEVLAMVGFLSLVLAVTGRETSELANLYLLPIITAGLALGRRATVIVLLAVCGCYVGLAMLSADGELTVSLAAQVVGALAPFILVAFLTTLLAANIETAKRRIRALSDHDELTNLYNMRAFTEMAGREHDVAARNDGPYSVLMVDVDALKSVNDTFGHEAGNKALRLVADVLMRLTRTSDIVARYGGDEFIICLRRADKAAGEEVAQRIRNVVFATTLEIEASIVRLKVSVGVGTYPEDGSTVQAVITSADRAMYKDKEYREPPKGRLIVHKR
jgi:diguanylate cyclase (GGDEF)-like protein